MTQEDQKIEKAILAGGCFWCMEKPFMELKGVLSVIPGYTGGELENPTYEQVCSGTTGHIEAVEVTFDSSVTDYTAILDVFWRQIDPTDENGQFVDRGSQYGTAIFTLDDTQAIKARDSCRALDMSGRFDRPIVTRILPAKQFYPAEDYHHAYYKKNPARYRSYRSLSGRESFLKNAWRADDMTLKPGQFEKPDPATLRDKLTPLQYQVTQENGTEPAFKNEYWENKRPGIYVDIVSGEPLFASIHKFDSGTGWPSFYKPITADTIVERKDRSLFMTRIEIRSKQADSHLGHVFEDGPDPTGLRYCMNSAALRFIPVEEMEKNGYGELLSLFDTPATDTEN